MAYRTEIQSVSFNVQQDADRLRQSTTRVQTPDLFLRKDPVPRGPYDPLMGTTDLRYRCVTCRNNRRDCPGHPGHIVLPFPVVLPLGVAEVRRWLRVVCLYCGGLMFDPVNHPRLAKVPPSQRLAVAGADIDTTDTACPSCRKIHPKIVKAPADNFSYQIEAGGLPRPIVILPYQLDRVFQRVSGATVAAMGRHPQKGHPRHLLIHNLQVPPVSIRPAVRMAGPGGYGSSFHDINNVLQYIIRASETHTGGGGPIALPPPGKPPSEDIAAAMINLQQLVYDLLQGSSVSAIQRNSGKRGIVSGNRGVVSIARRLPSKQGRFRKNLLGKRTWDIGRNTISGSCWFAINELGVPESFARSLQVAEVFQPGNRARLMRFFLNGRRQYPGASRIIRASTGSVHNVDGLGANFRPEDGDTLLRDIVTGDYACFNRQPSLERSAICVHKIVVLRDLNEETTRPTPLPYKTFVFNVIPCSLYGADFDGDEMTFFMLSRPGPRAEARFLSSVAQAFISTKTSGPTLGMVQDSTVGSFLVSREPEFDKLHAMELFERGQVTPPDFSDLSPGDRISGRQVVSRLLQQTPISLQRKPKWCSASAQPYVAIRPDETLTVIKRGVLQSGVLDKATVGSGASGGVFHRISRTHGTQKTLEVILALQQMTNVFLDQRGFTIGWGDTYIPPEKQAEVREILNGMMRDAEINNERLMRGDLVPPLGMTRSEYYDRLQLEALKVPDDILGPVLSAFDPDTNGLYQMVATGSKGNFKNIINISASVGQITINTKRIGAGNTGRTLAYFPRGDMSPAASGFVIGNYRNGLSAVEHYFGSMNGRNDLTNKAISTASTGYANRKAIIATQSLQTDATRAVCGPLVVQWLYGEDGMDARQIEPIAYPLTEISDAELRATFTVDSLKEEAWHLEEVAQLFRDRDAYRNVYLTVEQVNFSYAMPGKVFMAVDIKEITTTIAEDYEGSGGELPPKDLHDYVTDFCENLPYLLLNSAQQRLRAAAPPYMRAAVAHLARMVRVELSTARLVELGLDATALQLVFDTIRTRYMVALVSPGEAVGILAAQSISEPLTQYMLDSHHRSVSGGTNKSGIIRPQEIMGARPVEKEASSEMIFRGRVYDSTTGEFRVTGDKAVLQELADSVKLLTVSQLTDREDFLYESLPVENTTGNGMFPEFADDRVWISEFFKLNPLLKPPGNLTPWCGRFVLNRMSLVMKSITLETIVTRLREEFPQTYIVHTAESRTRRTPDIVVRIYLGEAFFRRSSSSSPVDPETVMNNTFKAILGRPIRGIPGIMDARIEKCVRHVVVADGPNAGKLTLEADSYAVHTVGTNLHGALRHPRVSRQSLVSSSIGDTIKMLGIEAGRTQIINEIRRVMGGRSPNVRHLQIYADQMTRTGKHTSFENAGIAAREPSNALMRGSAHSPVAALTKATFNGVVNPVYGMATPLIMGSIPRLGTNSVRLVMDGEFIAAQRKSASQIISSL